MSQLTQRVDSLLDDIRHGRILEALNEYYSTDVTMVEGTGQATVGLPANLEREQAFLDQVAEWHGFEVLARAVDEESGHALIESATEFTTTGGQRVRLEQVSAQVWRQGQIARERFYYNP